MSGLDGFLLGVPVGAFVMRFLLRKLHATTRAWRQSAEDWSRVAELRQKRAEKAEAVARDAIAQVEEWVP